MNVQDLIRHFSSRDDLHIDVQDDVIPVLQAAIPLLQVFCWPKDLDTDILRGQITHWDYPMEGETHNVIDIYYASSLSLEWQRVVCCKEIVHILDPVDCRVMTDEEFDKLCEKISLPPDLQDPVNDGKPVWTDRVAVFQAIAILFPWTCRQLLIGPYKEKKIPIEKVADLAAIPIRYARLVMSRNWELIHHTLTDN